MKNRKLKLATAALSAALMVTAVGGLGGSNSENLGQGVEVQAAVRKSEAQLRNTVLGRYPGQVLNHYVKWDDGVREHHYTIKQSSGRIIQVEITESGWITDVDYEGTVGSNGAWYDDDYYDWDDRYDDDYYDWD